MSKFEENLGIKESFPQYLLDKIMELVDSLQFNFTNRSPASYFVDGEQQLYYEFLENHVLKHFARLQSLPKTLTLHSINDVVEDKEIYHVLEFQYMPKRLKIDVKSNWEAMARLIR
jgi:exonuclease I